MDGCDISDAYECVQMRTNGLSWESVSAIAVTLIATVAISALAAATLQSP